MHNLATCPRNLYKSKNPAAGRKLAPQWIGANPFRHVTAAGSSMSVLCGSNSSGWRRANPHQYTKSQHILQASNSMLFKCKIGFSKNKKAESCPRLWENQTLF
ncbi:MAG: hypothetical protein ONB46_19975 [candidate division KSB1 bacterium]|nr:hypothetical protein [candidate division KSB1 bacterium]MDZ7368155.1 hypothetical protein [candidate division KSB1 bacterium]MDZ7405833.1 hypothetical protein [candidate division KSB1 bacterium]